MRGALVGLSSNPGLRICLPVLLLQTGPGAALEVSRSRDVAAPPAAVWALVGGFCAIAHWHPQVARCIAYDEGADADDGEGAAPVRGLVLAEGQGTIVEVETARDEARMSYTYAFISGPLPVSAYNATLAVRPNGTGTTVIWTGSFDPAGASEAEARAAIEAAYERGLAGIARETAR